jgi:hypothetical protein
MNVLYGENRFYRHVASHWIEMQQALIAMIVDGVFEFHPACAWASSKRRTPGCLVCSMAEALSWMVGEPLGTGLFSG